MVQNGHVSLPLAAVHQDSVGEAEPPELWGEGCVTAISTSTTMGGAGVVRSSTVTSRLLRPVGHVQLARRGSRRGAGGRVYRRLLPCLPSV